jgi:hypothetical protein
MSLEFSDNLFIPMNIVSVQQNLGNGVFLKEEDFRPSHACEVPLPSLILLP